MSSSNISNTIAITSFSLDEIMKDVNYDRIFLFILAYEYKMNFNQIMTLFRFSSDIFWTFINTMRPMLKLGDRKASMLKQSARKVYFKLLGSQVDLSPKENEYLTFLSQYLRDSFSNGEICLHIVSIDKFPIVAKGNFLDRRNGKSYSEMIIETREELFKNLDSIDYIILDNEVYIKTSRVEYMLEKYYGDLNSREIRRKTVNEIIKMMDGESIEAFNQDILDKINAIVKQREELVNRK